ncbi:MAG: amidohydrolase family protein [Saprospiraceae bacterium]|nr:amidohydrolase family protein [Saprospiraceae bacterium]
MKSKQLSNYGIISLLVIMVSCQPSGRIYEGAVCIHNIHTIDAESGLLKNQTVIVKGEKILKIAPSQELKLAPENTIIDGQGKFLIPGLWDAHVHFAYIEELAPVMFNLFLGYGITSVRDTGGKIDFVKKWKSKAEADPTAAPRVKIAGPLMDGKPNVYDGSIPTRPELSEGFATVEAAVKRVDELAALGVDLIKAYEMLSPEQFKAITKRARELNLNVTGHIPLSMDAITASKGFNSIEHLRNLEMSMTANPTILLAQRRKLLEEGKNEAGGDLRARLHDAQRYAAIELIDTVQRDKVIQALLENDTWQVPTLTLASGAKNKHFTKSVYQSSFNYLPEKISKQWKEGAAIAAGVIATPSRAAYADWVVEISSILHKAKVEFMAGTDCPIYFLTPGLSLHTELEMMSKAGMSPTEVLKAATLNPARYFDMEEELGLIKEGYIADLLILDANPLENISNTQKINTVIKSGKSYDRATLDAMLRKGSE